MKTLQDFEDKILVDEKGVINLDLITGILNRIEDLNEAVREAQQNYSALRYEFNRHALLQDIEEKPALKRYSIAELRDKITEFANTGLDTQFDSAFLDWLEQEDN